MADEGKTSGTRRIQKPATARVRRPPSAEKPEGVIEVVSTTGSEDSAVRKRVAPPRISKKGISLRLKITVAMVGVVFLAALLIFVVVYNKAVDQLNEEINGKGERIVNTLASIDEEYWLAAIYNDRVHDAKVLLKDLDPDLDPEELEEKLKSPELNVAFKDIVDPGGAARDATMRSAVTKILGKESWTSMLDTSPKVKATWARLLNPFGPYDGIQPLESLKTGNEDLVNLAVIDPSTGTAITIRGVTDMKNLPTPASGGLTVSETRENNRSVRIFIREGGSKSKLRYYASLSLVKIEDAKSTLFMSVFLTVLVGLGLGVGVAMLLSTFITKPLKVLMEDIQEVSSGNLDHETVPMSKDEIGMLATTFNKMTGALKTAHEQELEQKRMEHQLRIAQEVQENLMPQRIPKVPGFDIGAFNRPAEELGGDYYDFIDIDEGHLGLIVADVSGKGVPGGIVMAMALAFIRDEVDRTRNLSPMSTLVRANKMLARNIKKGMFVTAMYCILDKQTHELKIASAGHNPMVVWRAGKGAIELVNPKGIALGFDKGPVFERTVEEGSIVLEHGDRIVSYTDGAVEGMNAASEEFGDEKFQKLVAQLASRDSNQFLNLIVKALDEHKGAAPQHDDITLVTLRYL